LICAKTDLDTVNGINMTDAAVTPEEVVEKPSKLLLILGLVAALIGGGGGFYAAYAGLIFGSESNEEQTAVHDKAGTMPDVAFVPVEPLVISLSPSANSRHLRFRAQLEVPSQHATAVEVLMPRVVDVLNGYLRALEIQDIESAAALTRLRAQMLRRVQIVAGPGRINDLLIMEFVLN
jgi:flagellar FliL protein